MLILTFSIEIVWTLSTDSHGQWPRSVIVQLLSTISVFSLCAFTSGWPIYEPAPWFVSHRIQSSYPITSGWPIYEPAPWFVSHRIQSSYPITLRTSFTTTYLSPWCRKQQWLICMPLCKIFCTKIVLYELSGQYPTLQGKFFIWLFGWNKSN